ncbi:MAG: hypothetical protein ACLQK8_22770 [Streptosporangiaceae bacterium]|jgi:hypothetical protein|nr:hypothetical protein [Actinomycetota bacterium]
MSRYAKQPDHGSKGPAARREDCPEQADSRPPVQRLEYLFEVTDSAGATRMICDPAGPRTRTPFGDHSVLEFPGYREPAWLAGPAAAGQVSRHQVAAPWLSQPVPLILWSPAAADRAAPSPGPLLIGMTCGLAEENRAGNRLMAADLTALGHQVRLAEVPDAHTWTGWRDALDPHLTYLLSRAW